MRKVVYPHEYMDDSEKLDETSLHEKEDFYSHISIEDIIDADSVPTKTFCKDFEINFFVDYHELYVQSDTLLLGDVFENF